MQDNLFERDLNNFQNCEETQEMVNYSVELLRHSIREKGEIDDFNRIQSEKSMLSDLLVLFQGDLDQFKAKFLEIHSDILDLGKRTPTRYNTSPAITRPTSKQSSLSSFDESALDGLRSSQSSSEINQTTSKTTKSVSNTYLLTLLAHHIQENSSLEKIKNFIQERNIKNFNDWDENGIPPLVRAMSAGREELVELFVNLGADVNFKTRKGKFLFITRLLYLTIFFSSFHLVLIFKEILSSLLSLLFQNIIVPQCFDYCSPKVQTLK